MSLSVSKVVKLPQAALKFLVQDEVTEGPKREYQTNGGILSNTDYSWLSSGPRLEVVHTKSGSKVGAWTFGWVLKDSNTEVVCVDEIQRAHGKLPLLVVGVDCDFNGGKVCIFDFVTSKIIRAINIGAKITSLHVIDSGYDFFTLPSPLRNFDGIIAVGTAGGDVFLIDICRQICDDALTTEGLLEVRDELNPCQINLITSKEIQKIESHKKFAVTNGYHLAIHLNVVFDNLTTHFILRGPKGEDRIHVNKEEVAISALYYCPQLCSLLIGYNFGALQLFNLMNLALIYTSPVCEEHIPISHFAVQEPADDPRAFCYVWAVYSAGDDYQACLPLAVMYAFSYHTKEYHEGYGFLYQDFNTASVHYQMELGVPEGSRRLSKPLGGHCLRLTAINQGTVNREEAQHDSNEDILTLCVFVWCLWFKDKESWTYTSVFDLNQWYKEQMPSVPSSQYLSTFMHQICLNDLANSAGDQNFPILDAMIDRNSLKQFMSPQRLEEHFCPNSLSFNLCYLRECDLTLLHHYGVQKALLTQIESAGPTCLIEPAPMYQEIIGLGLLSLFIDLPVNTPVSTNQQREVILGTALENHLMGWLCKCASEWANGSFLAAGCSLDLLLNWAFERATTLKTNCDKICVPLFDYSEHRLDANAVILLNSCTRQLKNICSFYSFILRKLFVFISNRDLVDEQYKSLQMISVYFEVLQWLLNVGLLPECPLTAYPRTDDLDRINAPYPSEMLADFYNQRRTMLKINSENQFSTTSMLFIDNLIENECGGHLLQEEWRHDGGNGLYPPPSLQALLRTYLIDNVQLSNKHCITIYVFLDLAMTLDQERYKPVITHLIKFPAVFKVSPSIIKVTQAFWQLDHGDYNTAMGLLLDPLVLNEDLNSWHHKVVLRSLLLQKQHNFALLYLQVRKPAFKDDEDILTAISLFIANNMLDEAFYFKNNFSSQNYEQKILSHLFQECSRNDVLSSVIYRSLNIRDENFFLKYLINSKQTGSEDLHVYYHILRSQFMEAFESHDRTIPPHLKNQGLVGQENAAPRDKLVCGLKKLLPEINKSILVMCHKERSVSQKIERPTPMSIFVTNLSENVRYKSTLLAATLAKARETFNETVSEEHKLTTEETPFLRTPIASRRSTEYSAIYVDPKEFEGDDDESTPIPAKRLKLSPRCARASLSTSLISTKLHTPIVKRKTPKSVTTPQSSFTVETPHSILKTKSFNSSQISSKKDLERTPVTSTERKSSLGLSPRKSLAKSPGVRFEGLKNLSSDDSSRELHNKVTSRVNDSFKQLSDSSKNTSIEDDVFYSPETSLEESKIEDKKLEENNTTKLDEISTIQKSFTSSPVCSPKPRRSLKRSLNESTPIRSSPRLSKNSFIAESLTPKKTLPEEKLDETPIKPDEVTVDDSSICSTPAKSDEIKLDESPKVIPKLRPRKSLCRQVLETNALNRVLTTPIESSRKRKSKNLQEENKTVTTTETLHFETSLKFNDGQEFHSSDSITKHSLSKTSLLESDLDLSEDSVEQKSISAPILSASMIEYLNRKSSLNASEISDDTLNDQQEESLREELSLKAPEISDGTFDDQQEEGLKEEFPQEKNIVNISVEDCKSEISSIYDDSVQSSKLNFTFEAPKEKVTKLSDSMIHYINDFDKTEESIEEPSVQEQDEMMEVDEIFEISDDKEIEEDNNEKSVYEDLSNIEVSQKCDEDEIKELPCFEDISNNRPLDPEMNNFEITHDLSVNNSMMINQEVTLEENDYCYDQQNSLERVIEETINAPTSTSINPFEKNVFNEISSSSDEVDNKTLQDQAKEPQDDNKQGSDKSVKEAECEVIEIGSSSEEEKSSDFQSSDSSQSSYSGDGGEFDVSYEGNIYDTVSYTSESNSNEQSSSSGTGNSDENNDNRTEANLGLFQGDFWVEEKSEDEEDNDEEASEIKATPVERVTENKKHEEPALEIIEEALEIIEEQDIVEEDKQEAVGNIYDSVISNTSESNSNGQSSPNSKNSDEGKHNHTEANFGLFQGDILIEEKSEYKKDSGIIPVAEAIEDAKHKEMIKEDEQETVEDKKQEEEAIEVIEEKEEGIEVIVKKKQEEVTSTQTKFEKAEVDDKAEELKDQSAVDEEDFSLVYEPTDQVKQQEITDALPKTVHEDISEQKEKIRESLNLEEGTEKQSDNNKDFLESTHLWAPLKSVVSNESQVDIIDKIIMEDGIVDEASSRPSAATPRRSTRRISVDGERSSKVLDIGSTPLTPESSRVLRSRTISTEEPISQAPASRKRSASVEESKTTSRKAPQAKLTTISTEEPISQAPASRKRSASVEESKTTSQKEPQAKLTKPKARNQRAASVSHLPKITEEGDSHKHERARSVVEDYSLTRRLTRRQVTLLKQSVKSRDSDLDLMDPIVLLDRPTFDGNPDPDEKKVYETSPSTTNSGTSSPKKSARRLRSASQMSDRSRRSISKEIEEAAKPGKRVTRKTSADEISNISIDSKKSATKRKNVKATEENEPIEASVSPPKTRRGRTKSTSSVASDHSNASSTTRVTRSKQATAQVSTLPEIKEETSESEKTTAPKRRTRQNSQQ